ncbi:MAG: BMP family ABC transporter substrate-binding protein [Thermoproteota archaeon]|nr:BMP family ABC transporter substrate-binding protein [Thermoproteota archaeon]
MSSGETLVIALGGNALLKRGDKGTFEEQFANVVLASKEIVGLIEKDFRVVLTHGNGPQVGATLIRHDLAKNVVPPFPLHACNAETQGFIGYMIQQALQNELNRRNIAKSVVSVVTRVLVNRNDPSFQNPTKPIGPYFEKSQYPNLLNIFEGYKQGAKHVNPDIKVIETYLGDWDSPEKGKHAALAQIFSDADFILHVADTSGKGVIQAAKEKGIYAFGAVSDQNALAPDTVLTSFVLDIDKAFDQMVRTVVENRFEGKIYKPGLEASKGAPGEGIVYLAPFHNLEGRVLEDVKQRLNQTTQDIINGTIVVPEKYEVTTDFSQKSAVTATAETEPKILKIALVTDGLFSDGAWGAAAFNAAKQLETNYGHKVTCVDNIAIPEIETTLRQYSEDGYNLVIAHGFQWGDPAVRVGIEYPNTKYVVFTGLVASNNVASIFPMQQEATFLLGALAAMMSKTGTIGYVGGDKLDNFLTRVPDKIIWKYQGDAKYRRVVPSPTPVAILEYPVIRSLANSGHIVIACGGGGIPVIAGRDDEKVGIDAVIDKDLAGELLSRQIGAHKFIILTDVQGLYLDYRKPTQRLLSEVFVNKNDNPMNMLKLEEGSMGPKVHACLQFVKNGGKEAIIASLDNVVDAISGRTGTHFYP